MIKNIIDITAVTESQVKSAAGTLEKFLAGRGISLAHTAALDCISAVAGVADWRSLKAALQGHAKTRAGTPLKISLDDFEARFKPMANHLRETETFEGCAFETSSADYEYVREMAEKHPDRVWTVVDADAGSWLVSGWHYVNRSFYVITQVGCPPDETYEIPYGHDITDKLFEVCVYDTRGTEVAYRDTVYASCAGAAREERSSDIDEEVAQILEAGGTPCVSTTQV